MNNQRPDPDQLLQKLDTEAARARRGHLKIFFGACAGVGKTYAMLAAAQQLPRGNPCAMIGVVETHGRSETEALTRVLARLPMREVNHRGRRLREFDLDAALHFGTTHPCALLLVDELAHSNAPSSRHPKRWQDVVELLAAGIDVWTTMNVQHLEHLNDIISGITGIRVWETVPDRIFDEAEEVVVVDLPPDELIQRLRQGKVYLPRQAELATHNFFRKGNLLALRELALRRAADRVDSEMQAYRQRNTIARVWPNRESLLACVSEHAAAEKVVRSCARLAAQLGVSWHAVHVDAATALGRSARARERVLRVMQLAHELGAVTETLVAPSVAKALVHYAHEHNLSRLVLGRGVRRWPWQRSLADALGDASRELDILLIADGRAEIPRPRQGLAHAQWLPEPAPLRGYLLALLACALVTLIVQPFATLLQPTNIVMLYLLAVVGVALRHGRAPALLAGVCGVASFDFFFVPPYYTFAVTDTRYYIATFFVMLVVALVIGQLTAGLKIQAEAAMARERRMHALYDMSRDLSAALILEQIGEIGAHFLASQFGAKSALLVADDADRLREIPGGNAKVDMLVAQWAFDHAQIAGRGTGTLHDSACLVLPLKATMRLRGILAIEPADDRPLSPEHRRLLSTCASLLAISIERIHYIEVARTTTVQMESERLRNSLLSAISHELRTPLATMIGLTDAFEWTEPAIDERQTDLVRAIRHSAQRMNTLVNNLLDMVRLESGVVTLNLQWQPLEEIIGSALSTCKPLLGARVIKIDLAPTLPLLHLDAVLIERVLVNLLENAAKYTPPASHIEIEGRESDDAVHLVVSDSGPGLPAGREHALFEKFERGKHEKTTSGVGLGLAICRAIMHAHHGGIRGENRAQGGARFVLTFPRKEPPKDDGSQPAADGDT